MRAIAAAALAAGILCFIDAAAALEGWERLGIRTVEFRQDRDTIFVGRNEGRFRALMLEVTDGSVEMDNIRVVFGNGRSFSPPIRLVFEENSRSRVIDLPGAARIVRSITFNYRSLNRRQGRATVTVYGR
jgi:hypothetical protein